MGSIRFEIDVEDGDIADQLERRIEAGMQNAVKERNSNSIGRVMKRAAKEHIHRHGRVWTTELITSFDITADTSGDSVNLVLTNDAGHAASIDTGATYGDEGPPLHRLIPWVESKLKGYKVRGGALVQYENDSGGKTILTDGSGKVRGSSRDLPPDLQVESVHSLESQGFEGGSNRNSAHYIVFEDGQNAYFQEYKEPGDLGGSDYGTVRNEAVFTRIAAEEDWRIGPENRAGNIVDPENDEVIRGNFQRWIDDGVALDEELYDEFTPADADLMYEPHEFVEQHEEWLAQTTVLDILLGNSDRHEGNIILDPDGNPHAIDNGGHFLPSTQGALEDMLPTTSIITGVDAFMDIDEYPELETALSNMFSRQLALLELMLDDHEEDILTHFRLIHGRHSEVYQRVENLLDHQTQEILDHVKDKQDNILASRSAGSDLEAVLEQDDVQSINDIMNNLEDELNDI